MKRRPHEHCGHDHDARTRTQYAGACALENEYVVAARWRDAAGAALDETTAERAHELTFGKVVVEPAGDVRAGSKANEVHDENE